LFALDIAIEKKSKRTKKTGIDKTPCSVQKGQKENTTNIGVSFHPFAPVRAVLGALSVFFFSLFFFCFSMAAVGGAFFKE